MTPLFIIGAPRSGTNMLRNAICKYSNTVSTWDCDELPFIWRYNNFSKKTDILNKNDLNEKIITYITGKFEALARKDNCKYVLEKTCANSLRLEFIDSIFPDAIYLFIIRNGFDSISSNMVERKKSYKILYRLKKIRHTHKIELILYLAKYLYTTLKSIFLPVPKIWGPKFCNDEDLLFMSKLEVSTKQWLHCVNYSYNFFQKHDENKYLIIKYEELVDEPYKIFSRINKKFNLDLNLEKLKNDNYIHKNSLNKSLNNLSEFELNQIEKIIRPTLTRIGY